MVDAAAGAGRAAASRPTPPTRWRWRSATPGAATPRPASPPRGRRPEAGRARRAAPARPPRVAAGGLGDRLRARRGGRGRRRTAAVIDVGGVGLRAAVHPGHARRAARRRARPTLATALVVREDSLTLFGFADADERAVFERAADRHRRRAEARAGRCWRCSRPTRLRRAVATEDLRRSPRSPAIGRKGAQRLVLELKDGSARRPAARRPRAVRRGAGAASAGATRCTPRCSASGWSPREAEAAVAAVAGGRRAGRRPTSPTVLRARSAAALRAAHARTT